MKTLYKIILLSSLIFLGSCELDLLDDPNNGKVETADVGMLLNAVELEFNNLINNLSGNSRGYTRMTYQSGKYVQGDTNFDSAWRLYYAGLLADTKILKEIAESEEKKLYKQAGVAKILEAYATVCMVDFFGNIPYSEALQGSDNVNPKADLDVDIYNKMHLLLDEAIEDLNNPNANEYEFSDVYFGEDYSKWEALARTLKFKMYVQTRKYDAGANVDAINELLSSDLIDENNENFEFKYGTSISAPDTRNSLYTSNYRFGGVSGYMSNSFMFELLDKNDPRLRYYFLRQANEAPEDEFLVCSMDEAEEDDNMLCYIGNKYWGRDHATTAGIPPDDDKRTTWGLYPAGGRFDSDSWGTADGGQGAQGAGINPILLSSFVNFLKAEAMLTIPGVEGDPAEFYEKGIRLSIERVMAFENLEGVNIPESLRPSDYTVDVFVLNRMNNYNYYTSSDDEKLELIMRQYWVALWGNGIESYNNYRRTGFPNLQHPLTEGNIFPRLNMYPAVYTSYNSNASVQSITNQVFWDTNPENFID